MTSWIRSYLMMNLSPVGLTRTLRKVKYLTLRLKNRNEEMNYWETVRAVRAFLGWSYIPDLNHQWGMLTVQTIYGRESPRKNQPRYQWNFQRMIGFAIKWRNLIPGLLRGTLCVYKNLRDSKLIRLYTHTPHQKPGKVVLAVPVETGY